MPPSHTSLSPTGPDLAALLALTLTSGLGPILIRRLLEQFKSAPEALAASLAALKTVRGIGDAKALAIHTGLQTAPARAEAELARADALGISLLALGQPEYPPLLAQIPDAPPILYVRGTLLTAAPASSTDPSDRFPVALVGSRRATPYGIEQAERFAGHLAASGLTIISGGARGIDTAAHRSALRNNGRTVAVLGCGLAHVYPEENAELFDRICAPDEAGTPRGAVVSELPLDTPPSSENFPARNRIISGLSLGVLVIEAGRGSGALITAKAAAEDHGREVFALPGRVDSAASQGTHDLLKSGGALLVTEPPDIIAALESPARHLHGDTHAARYLPPSGLGSQEKREVQGLFAHPEQPKVAPAATRVEIKLTASQTAIMNALQSPLTPDELCVQTGLTPAALRTDLTFLEIQRRVSRTGSKIRRVVG